MTSHVVKCYVSLTRLTGRGELVEDGASSAVFLELIDGKKDVQQWDVYIHDARAWLKQHHRWIDPT